MRSAAALTYDSYCRAVQDVSVSFVLTRRAEANWGLEFVGGRRVSAQLGSDGGASIADGTMRPHAYLILCRHHHCRTRITLNGEDVADHDFVVVPPGHHFIFAADGPRTWISIAVPVKLVRAVLPHHRSDQIRRQPGVFKATASLHGELLQMTENYRLAKASDPEDLTLDGLERRLAGRCCNIVVRWMNAGVGISDPLHQEAVTVVTRALCALHGDTIGDRWLVEDLADAAGVSTRTVLRAFHKILNMGPKRYLQLRQLNLIRQALQVPAKHATVTDIMSIAGVTELGRVAGQYKELFGELPSETMHATRLLFECGPAT